MMKAVFFKCDKMKVKVVVMHDEQRREPKG